MAFFYKNDLPIAGGTSTKFAVPCTDIGDGSNDYGTVVAAASGNWVLGSLLKGRKVLAVINTGAATGSPTNLKVGLYEAAAATGDSNSLVTGTDTVYSTALDGNVRTVEIAITSVDETKYYSLGASVKGGGSTALLTSVSGFIIDAPHVS